jgi:formylglycine-generating enzyme required for sulfatase activity
MDKGRIPFLFILPIIGPTLLLAGISYAAEQKQNNSIGMEFVLIPSGSFLMGSPDTDEDANRDEKPQHRVTISKQFYLGRYEVTQAQWEAVMGSHPFTSPRSNSFYHLPGMAERLRKPNNPATVSWNDAQEFIERLNRKEGHAKYRLPTEAEWEYAARAGTTTSYSFGADAKNLARYAWFGEDFETGSTHAVGQKKPNPWGLYDMHGNVWEWTEDWYGEQYYGESPAEYPVGPDSGMGRVVRGGSWHTTGNGWRSASRRHYLTDYRGISVGFRIAYSVH